MTDLDDMSAVDALRWLAGFIHTSSMSTASDKPSLRDVMPFVEHGVTDTATIERHWRSHAVIATLPAGEHLAAADVEQFLHVGGPAWVGDPDSRDEWEAVGRKAARREAARDRHYHRGANLPRMRRAYAIGPDEVVTGLYTAGRGPTYAHRILDIAERFPDAHVDAFGYGDDITPAVYDDLLTAGIRSPDDLTIYTRHGLTVAEAIEYRGSGIPAAAVGKAASEGYVKGQWREVLDGLPIEWFRVYHGLWQDDVDVDSHYLAHGGNDRYTLADLRYLVEHGWTGQHTLSPNGLSWSSRANPAVDVAGLARTLADHGLTWDAMNGWAKALAQGKARRGGRYDDPTVLPPLLRGSSHQRGYGTNSIGVADLDRVFLLADRGIKPSHLGTYRKAGCRSPEDIVTAYDRGITPKVTEWLLAEHGTQPSRYKSTRLIPTLTALLHLWEREQAQEVSA